MQGQIGFEDNQERAPTDKGSTFWFELDIAKKQLPQRTKQQSAEAQKDASSVQPEDTSL